MFDWSRPRARRTKTLNSIRFFLPLCHPQKNPSISPILHAIITLDFSKHRCNPDLYLPLDSLQTMFPLTDLSEMRARGAFTQIEILLFRLFILSHHIAPPLRGQNDASFMRHFVYTTALLLAVLACYDTFFAILLCSSVQTALWASIFGRLDKLLKSCWQNMRWTLNTLWQNSDFWPKNQNFEF